MSGMEFPATARRSPASAGADIPIDPFRSLLFPNAVRERRQQAGFASLLALSALLPAIPYIRLSKIERGEVFARADELRAIAAAIGLEEPAALLVDVEDKGFSLQRWISDAGDDPAYDREAEELAMLLAAAFRARRAQDRALTLARLRDEYHLPPVMVSRIENALKPFGRWNRATVTSLCTLFGVVGQQALASYLRKELDAGRLSEWLARIPGAAEREARTRERIGALRTELGRLPAMDASVSTARPVRERPAKGRALQVMGVPIGDGLIEPVPNPQHIIPPPGAGPRAYALRMCRPSLGAAIPGGAVLIVDPARYPANGGLAVLREERGLRVLTVTTDRDGHLLGHSSNPEKQVALDAIPPSDLAMVTAILFV